MKRTIERYLRALGQPYTIDLRRNVYLWFGFLWGIPIPIFSLALDCTLGAEGRGPWKALLEHPVHLFFLAHPFLFALIFGTMGTVRHVLEGENARLIQSLTDLATTDALTGLHNRRYVLEELHKALQRSRRSDQRFAVLLFDLDGFKTINDTQGHAAGDAVLRKVAAGLQSVVREGDVLGRYGGDEFLLVTYGDLTSLQSLASRAEEKVRESTGLGLSAGVARFPEDGATAEALVDEADRLLAAVKELRYAQKGTARRGSEQRKSAVDGELPA
jgi:diguanylate cyclase (GGDEF)-like protein